MDKALENRERELQAQIRELQTRVEDLRLGRRILMNLVEMLEKNRREQVAALEQEVTRLRLHNRYLARLLWEKSRTIAQLQTKCDSEQMASCFRKHHPVNG